MRLPAVVAGVLAAVLTLSACAGDRTEGRFGQDLYMVSCAGCHGGTGAGSGAAPALGVGSPSVNLADHQIASVIRIGPGAMPSFERLSDEQVDSLVAFIRTLQ